MKVTYPNGAESLIRNREYVVKYSLSKANLYAINHPYIMESATYDVGP